MARIRTVKPDFFADEKVAEMDCRTRLFFIGLWTLCDVEGRCEERPKFFKREVFPYDEGVDIEALLSTLATKGFIVRYSVGEKAYIWVRNFRRHQRFSGKEAQYPSTIPGPPEDEGSNGEATGKLPGTQEEGKEYGELPANAGSTVDQPGQPALVVVTADPKPGSAQEAKPKKEADPDSPFGIAAKTLGLAYAALGWDPPDDIDVRKCLKPDSPVQRLAAKYTPEGAAAMFVWAYNNWNQKPTWNAVYTQRNQIHEGIKGKASPSQAKGPKSITDRFAQLKAEAERGQDAAA